MALKDYLVPVGQNANICFDCQKACSGCSWSELDYNTGKPRFEPIPGWKAEKVPYCSGWNAYGGKYEDTYHITACPEFVRDEPRKSSSKELSDLDWIRMLRKMGRVRRVKGKVVYDG